MNINEIDNKPINPVNGSNSLFSIGSIILLAVSIFMTIGTKINNQLIEQEQKLNCNVKLYVVEEGISEIVILGSDAKILCREFYKEKDDYDDYGNYLKPERRFVLYINEEEIIIDPFNNQYAYKDHSMLFSKSFNDTLDLYIDFVTIKRSGVDFNYSGNLTFEERVKIYTYFFDSKYETTNVNLNVTFKQYIEIAGEYYYFDDYNNYMVHDGTIIVDDEIMFLIKKAFGDEYEK